MVQDYLQDQPKLYYDSRRPKHAQGCSLLASHGVLRSTTHFS